jgi:uncharacterized protein
VLRDLGFYDVRVRHHELGGGARLQVPESGNVLSLNFRPAAVQHLARIEVGPAEMAKFLANGSSGKIAEALKRIGYAHVTLDLQGYRRGSTNEPLKPSA